MRLTTENTEGTEAVTPETDARAVSHIGFFSCATVPAQFARKLERERNDARKTAEQWRKVFFLYHACITHEPLAPVGNHPFPWEDGK
jgi:hypothetical protein